MASRLKYRGRPRNKQGSGSMLCFHCGGELKLGRKNENGEQRYYCTKCNKTLQTYVVKTNASNY